MGPGAQRLSAIINEEKDTKQLCPRSCDFSSLRRETVKNTDSFKTAACPAYEELLKQCQAALEIWEQRRDEICRSRLTGTEKGGELLGLQADFTAKYALLRRHVDECRLCQFVSKLGGCDYIGTLHSISQARVLV